MYITENMKEGNKNHSWGHVHCLPQSVFPVVGWKERHRDDI